MVTNERKCQFIHEDETGKYKLYPVTKVEHVEGLGAEGKGFIAGRATNEGGAIFGDYENNRAMAEFAAAFGSETKATGKAAFVGGLKKDRSGAPDEPTDSDWRYCEAVGDASMAFGMGAVAYSRASKSLGYRTQTGYPPSAEHAQARPEAVVMTDKNGQPVYPADNKAQAAVAIGSDTAAVGNNTLAGGWKTKAAGDAAVALGRETCADGPYSLSIGAFTKALGNWSIAGGYRTQAVNEGAIALGKDTVAEGAYAIALGKENSAIGECSVAVGFGCIASGVYSSAGGYQSKSRGKMSMAFGSACATDGHYSVAIGGGNNTRANCTAVFGYHNYSAKQCNEDGSTIDGSPGFAQTVVGRHNAYKNGEIDKALFVVGNGTGDATSARSNAFLVDMTGSVHGKKAYSTFGADYAEFFEWEDGNPNDEDRVGLVVALDGEKIRLAQAGDEVLGIVSGTAAVLGDCASMHWKGKYLTDEFGRTLYDMVEDFMEEEDPETGEVTQVSMGVFPHPRLNPDYNPEEAYVPRENRPEWDAIGMFGKLYTRDDGSCLVGGYACAGDNGQLTHSDTPTNIRILKRTGDNIVIALLK